MPFKRPLSSHTSDESPSPGDKPSPSGLVRSSPPRNFIEEEKPLLVYILPGKILPEAMSELVTLVESYQIGRVAMGYQGQGVVNELNVQLTGDVEKANVIVTAIHMRQRLERHIDWRIAVCTPLFVG
jgi:hypothetical protein